MFIGFIYWGSLSNCAKLKSGLKWAANRCKPFFELDQMFGVGVVMTSEYGGFEHAPDADALQDPAL